MAKNLVNGERLRLVIDHISKHYKDLAETEMVALRNVDIIVDNEEWVAMLGPSGTGK
jgi:NitT/TauT family transport system ATP-binding protein